MMPHRPLIALLATPLLAACVAAGPAATQPHNQPPPATAATAPDALTTWLDRIDARADELDTLTAEVKYERIQGLLGDRQIRFGDLRYHAGPPAKFALDFDRLVVGRHIEPRDHAFIFDGRWLAERLGDRQQFIRRELVPEGEAGRDLLRLGEGPVALPLDLQKQTVLERFDASLIEPSPDDPDNTIHLRLIPHKDLAVDQSQIDLWYDRDMLLPVKVHTVNEEEETESVIWLRNLEPGAPVAPETFDTSPPEEPGWRVEIKPLDNGR